MSGLILKSFSLGGYKSFGKNIQIFDKLGKINLLIGKNNCGKSNVLLFLHDIYPNLTLPGKIKLDQLERHIPFGATFIVGQSISLEKDDEGNYSEFFEAILPKFNEIDHTRHFPGDVLMLFQQKAKLNSTDDVCLRLHMALSLSKMVGRKHSIF